MHPLPCVFLRRPFLPRWIAGAAALAIAAAATAERAHVVVLGTTDLHARILPVDYATNRPEQYGLAKIATLVAQARRDQPGLLLLDCGDTIQGSPLGYFHARRNNAPPDPMMLAMNALGFDAMTVGNHEFNFGLAVLEKARSEAVFPWLSANICSATGESAFVPCTVKTVQGVRIGVAGITTPGIPAWENPENHAGLEFHDPVVEARRWVAHLRERERADVVIAAVHMGLEEDLRTGEPEPAVVPNENAALALARSVPGIDAILMGHTHREVPGLAVGGVLLVQAGRWGDCLARIDIYLDREDGGSWTVVGKAGRTIPVTDAVAADPAITALVAPYDAETQTWLGQEIGRSAVELRATESRLRDTAILDLVNRVQLDAGAADVSMAASFNLEACVPAGAVTVRDIAGLYVYDNTLVVVEATGAQIEEALEHAARCFLPWEPGKTAAELVDRRMRGYNFDVAEGVDYEIDLRRPVGDRIAGLRFHGEPLDPGRKLRLAINNYRYNGGGGYTMLAGLPVLWRSSVEIRDLIVDWVESHGTVPSEPTENWRIVPGP